MYVVAPYEHYISTTVNLCRENATPALLHGRPRVASNLWLTVLTYSSQLCPNSRHAGLLFISQLTLHVPHFIATTSTSQGSQAPFLPTPSLPFSPPISRDTAGLTLISVHRNSHLPSVPPSQILTYIIYITHIYLHIQTTLKILPSHLYITASCLILNLFTAKSILYHYKTCTLASLCIHFIYFLLLSTLI